MRKIEIPVFDVVLYAASFYFAYTGEIVTSLLFLVLVRVNRIERQLEKGGV